MREGPLRWAVIGAGGMGEEHVRAILNCSDARLVAACDVNSSALAALPTEVRRFNDWTTLLEAVDLDAASVILPHHLYPEVVTALLRRGVHVLKEKAFARNLQGALAMCQAAQESGRQLMVAGQRKFASSFVTAQQHVAELGEIFLTRASILYRSASIVEEGRWGWRGSRQLSGGVALLDSGWHIVEMVTLLRGLPARVTASAGGMRISAGDFDVDEQAALILEYPDGGLAVVLASFVAAPVETRLILYGKKMTLDIDVHRDRVALIRGSQAQDLSVGATRDTMAQTYDLFISSIATGSRPAGHWSNAIHVQRIIEAGYRSIAQGAIPVNLSELPSIAEV